MQDLITVSLLVVNRRQKEALRAFLIKEKTLFDNSILFEKWRFGDE